MKPVRLGFEAPASPLRERLLGRTPGRATAIALLAVAAASAGGAFVAWQAWQLEREWAQARASLASLQRKNSRRPDPVVAPARPQLTAAQRQAWSQVARQLNTPWAALLDALESGTPDTVSVVSIEPDAGAGSVRLQVEARTLDTLLAYATALGTSPQFESVALLKHETNEQDRNRPLRLALDLRLKAATQ